MSQANEIRIEDFQFQSMRKYMFVLYWRLRHAEAFTPEEKIKIAKGVFCDFFVRIRKFRNINVNEMAARLNKSVLEIEAFESGERRSLELEYSYCKMLQASHEFEYFERRLWEFNNPGTREEKKAIAKNLLKKFGIIMPDIDLLRLNSPPAKVIELFSKK